MRTILALSAALTLLACATAPAPDSQVTVGNGDDCAVVATVLRKHFGFGPTQRSEPLVFIEGLSEETCNWAQHGLAAPLIYDPETALWAPRYVVHVSRPRYFSGGAVVETSERRGSQVWSRRYELTLSGVMGWIVLPPEWEDSASAAG